MGAAATVHLSYVREKTGHALAGARQWIPAEDIRDPVKSLVTGLPLNLRFRTKGQLAIGILAGAYADGPCFDFAQRWLHRIPMPFDSRDRDAGYW